MKFVSPGELNYLNQDKAVIMMKKKECIEASRALINNDDFRSRHRTSERYFTRCRKLTFVVMMLLLLRKSVKSLQCVINELFIALGLESVTAAAFSRARQHICHTAFIELNEKAVVEILYRDGNYRRYKQFRVLAVDGSKIRLPETEEINKKFPTVNFPVIRSLFFHI